MSAEKITEVLVAHTQHLIVPATDDPNGPWDVECNCDAEMTAQGFIAGERMHAEHVAAALEPVIQERERVACNVGYDKAKDDGDFYDINANPCDTKEEA